MAGDFDRVAVIGGGLIGASWAALFLAQGMQVAVQDPRKDADAEVARFVKDAWDDLVALGLAKGEVSAALSRLQVVQDVTRACRDAEFIQECGPDRIDAKHQIVAAVEAASGPEVVIASSSSSLMASDIQVGARYPGRILVAHPFNPPHLIPLVELVRGDETTTAAMDTARAFYTRLGREIIEPLREVRGHVANRLTAALYREAVHLVAEGIATVADVDRAIASGPGLRWALMGPHLTYHLGGGSGGFRHYITHLGPTQAARWAELGDPDLTDEVMERLIDGVDEELAQIDADTLADRRDRAIVGLLQLKKRLDL